MKEATTLRELIEQHPEWADLQITIHDSRSGEQDFLGGAGTCYESEDLNCEDPQEYEKYAAMDWDDVPDEFKMKVLTFAGN